MEMKRASILQLPALSKACRPAVYDSCGQLLFCPHTTICPYGCVVIISMFSHHLSAGGHSTTSWERDILANRQSIIKLRRQVGEGMSESNKAGIRGRFCGQGTVVGDDLLPVTLR